jgi:hypothetical protein
VPLPTGNSLVIVHFSAITGVCWPKKQRQNKERKAKKKWRKFLPSTQFSEH